jgi:hypothetical protein
MNFKVYSDNLLNFSEETTERYQILTDEAMTFLSYFIISIHSDLYF